MSESVRVSVQRGMVEELYSPSQSYDDCNRNCTQRDRERGGTQRHRVRHTVGQRHRVRHTVVTAV